MAENEGDHAFRATSSKGRTFEQNYSGALSFLRRRYTRDLSACLLYTSDAADD